MTDDTYRWLVARCLDLELQIAVLKGLEVLLPAIERPSLYDAPPQPRRRIARPVPIRRYVRPLTPQEIAQMQALRRAGHTPNQIAAITGFGETTARIHTRDVLREREVGS